MEFGLAHRAPKAQEQTIIILARIIEAILVDDEGIGEGTDLNEAIPLATGPSEARGLQTDYRARSAQADFGDQILKSGAPYRRRSRAPLVLVDDHNQRVRPAELPYPLGQLVLAGCAGGIL